LVEKFTQDFRWSHYKVRLNEIEKINVLIDNIVLIQDNNMPPLKWKLDKVIETHVGTDDKIRVITLKTVSEICKTAINKLLTTDC